MPPSRSVRPATPPATLSTAAARDTEDLRSFVVENLNADADVAGTQTSLIFEHLRGAAPI